MLIVACALGFLIWNWAPAVFMGDVGSVPLGYLIGWLLISVVVPSNSWDRAYDHSSFASLLLWILQ